MRNNSITQYVLGIESSCDDTGVAIVSSDKSILSNIVTTQNDHHKSFGGVVPEIAARMHIRYLRTAVYEAIHNSKLTLNDMHAIAATCGPGLIGGVIVGAMLGRALASVLNKPFIAINHLEGHALTARLTNNVPYPYLLLLISGGHCQFIAIKELGQYTILGTTVDDAIGEAFDKVAKMLGLPFPGGPIIEQRAKLGNTHKYILPQPMINQNGANMSFSGLKTAVKHLITEQMQHNSEVLPPQIINDISASVQYTIGQVLCNKLNAAIKLYEKIASSKRLVMAGGVAANMYLSNIMAIQADKHGYECIVPPPKLCTDNAAMIAFAGLERLRANKINCTNIIRARWNIEDIE